MKIGHVAGDMEGRDLPHAVRILIEPTDVAGYDETGMIRPLAKFDEVPIGLHL
jgi:hypothetical protein